MGRTQQMLGNTIVAGEVIQHDLFPSLLDTTLVTGRGLLEALDLLYCQTGLETLLASLLGLGGLGTDMFKRKFEF